MTAYPFTSALKRADFSSLAIDRSAYDWLRSSQDIAASDDTIGRTLLGEWKLQPVTKQCPQCRSACAGQIANCPACGYGFSGERPNASWERRMAPIVLI